MARQSKSTALVPFDDNKAPALPSSWQDRLSQHAERQKAVIGTISGGWPFLSFKGASIHLGDDKFDNPVDVIVLDAIFEKAYYEDEYDPGNTSAPKCWALGTDEKTLAPPADLPTKQSDACVNCKWNAFGTDNRGRGKACKDTKRVAVLHADLLQDHKALKEQEGVRFRVSTMSLKGWAKFQKLINEHFSRPLWALVSKLQIVPDTRAQQLCLISPSEWITDPKALEILEKRCEEAQDYLRQEPQRQTEETPRGGKPAPRRRKVERREEEPGIGAPPAASASRKNPRKKF